MAGDGFTWSHLFSSVTVARESTGRGEHCSPLKLPQFPRTFLLMAAELVLEVAATTGLAWPWLHLAGAVKLCLDAPTDSLFPCANILAANVGRSPDQNHRACIPKSCPAAAQMI